MTLITFQSRIHFASDVLEEALRAELEDCGHRNVLIVAEAQLTGGQFLDRVKMGLPGGVSSQIVWIAGDDTSRDTASQVLSVKSALTYDVVIACGTARAIYHGRKCRQAIGQSRYVAQSKEERSAKGARMCQPDFFAIPGIDGLPDPCMAGGAAATEKTAPPNVIICDPTLLTGASPFEIANSLTITLGRCLAAFAGSNFNPLADGMAVEGLRRLAKVFPCAMDKQLEPSEGRDLMAASLNGSISQQKGPGLVQAIANGLLRQTHAHVDSGSLYRILLPHLLRDLELINAQDEPLLSKALDVTGQTPLSNSIEQMLNPLPLNTSLRDLGFAKEDFQLAIVDAQTRVHMLPQNVERLNSIVEDVY